MRQGDGGPNEVRVAGVAERPFGKHRAEQPTAANGPHSISPEHQSLAGGLMEVNQILGKPPRALLQRPVKLRQQRKGPKVRGEALFSRTFEVSS